MWRNMVVDNSSIRIVSYPMNKTTLRTTQTRLDLMQDTTARRIGVATDTVARWERNELAIREPMSHVIRLLESHNNG